MSPALLEEIAATLVANFGSDRLVPRLTEQYPDFSIDDGYAVAHLVRQLRQARGEAPVGRKIGGTNPSWWAMLGISGPVWNFMYDTTVVDFGACEGDFTLGAFRQPRIEPELVLHLCAAPHAEMDEKELLGCIDRVAHGYEFVHSPFSTWSVRAPDSSAAYGLHQALLVGPWHDITADRAGWGQMLKAFTVVLTDGAGQERHGGGANVLGSPVLALAAMVEDIAAHPARLPLAAGEIVTTGTLTELMPVAPGETWTTTINGAPLEGLTVHIL
jgi:2-oxo-3-hexenedioate decarboxylase